MIGVGSAGNADGRAEPPAATRASERQCWIAWSLVPGIGPAGFAHLLHRFGSATAAWRAGAEALVGLPRGADRAERVDPAATAILQRDPAELAVRLETRTDRAGGRIVTALDGDYPHALFTLDPRPPTLSIRGDAAAFEQRAVAVVGTRRASGYGLSVAIELGAELARGGVVVVSGLALGIDGAAHRAAVDAGGRSIAVLPSPLDGIYPPRHRDLARRIVEQGGALVTEVAIGARIGRPDFARRNRVIAGLSEAVVVVEAPDRSGALLTAAAAMAIGRELFAVPGPIDAMASRGPNRLIADKQADVVTSVTALMQQIGLDRGEAPPAVSRLSEVEGQLLRTLLERSGSIEELVDRTRQQPAAVASALSLLEARGLANSFGGATFHPTLAAKRLARVV